MQQQRVEDGPNPLELELFEEVCSASADAASSLSRLWKQSAHAKLLQRPPNEHTSAKHPRLFVKTLETLLQHLCVCLIHNSSSSSSSSSSSRLLLQAAEELTQSGLLQQLPHFVQQSVQLIAAAGQPLASLPPKHDSAHDQASSQCGDAQRMCHHQTRVLWANQRWQTPMELLQQGGGQVLLLALTLAMHCCSSRGCSRGWGAQQLLLVIKSDIGPKEGALCVGQELFTSQLARQHPVPFFQFLDICARTVMGGAQGDHWLQL
ncbi:hypothetical protein OEZ86_003331 [Tetradesmus obliquus]|nr:hypothetical protein OEZ86_003331 [Tetradesmus obliquus]